MLGCARRPEKKAFQSIEQAISLSQVLDVYMTLHSGASSCNGATSVTFSAVGEMVPQDLLVLLDDLVEVVEIDSEVILVRVPIKALLVFGARIDAGSGLCRQQAALLKHPVDDDVNVLARHGLVRGVQQRSATSISGS